MNMTLARVLDSHAPHPVGAERVIITGITADSRAVKPGYLFAALPGSVVDGAKFIDQALAAGAVAVLTGQHVSHPHAALIKVENPRRVLAMAAARFSGEQPETIVAVTGTNGKTSVSVFVRQIWEAMGFRAASLGTIGAFGPDGKTYKLEATTPDPVKLAEVAASLRAVDHVRHLAVEASSHGLDQYRLDGLRLTAGGFTNLTRDHLDYHTTMESYRDAKLRLFTEVLGNGSSAVINADDPSAEYFIAAAKARHLNLLTVGQGGAEIRLLDVQQDGLEQHLMIDCMGRKYRVALPLVGDFQASNALVAVGLVIAAGGDESQAFHALESLIGATGRMEIVGRSAKGAAVFVDYAHTPDALLKALQSLRPSVKGQLSVVFGCGGDRDPGKRPQMGAIAVANADRVYVTDDNPRTEDAGLIRRSAMAGAPGATEIADRAKAIRTAVEELQAGDVLLIAGKGHEQGQIIGKVTLPFMDQEAARAAIKGEDYHG